MTRDEVPRGDPGRGTNVEIVTRWRDRLGVKCMTPLELAALGSVLWDAADYDRVRTLKSKPPEKSPEVEAPKDTETAFGEIYEALDCLKEHLARGRQAEAERDALRRQLPQYDCTHTGGPVSDSGGKHCPPESPCLTCRLERAEERATNAEALAELRSGESCAKERAAGNGGCGMCAWCCLQALRRAEAAEVRTAKAEAELANLRWQQSGSPMKGE